MIEQLQFVNPIEAISNELSLAKSGVLAVVKLLLDGNTIPFIARYRKEATGGLDEVQIRTIQERYDYLKELDERKVTILQSIESQGKLTEELRKKIIACEVKNTLEDLYLPYKPKRRTRATIAKEKGLEELGLKIISQPIQGDPFLEAEKFVNEEKGVANVDDALSGARDIAAEYVAENAQVRGFIRERFTQEGLVISHVKEEHKGSSTKFNDYYEFSERVAKIPSHRYLAIRRGEREGILSFKIEISEEENLPEVERLSEVNPKSPYAEQYKRAVRDAFRRLITPSVETDVRVELKVSSDSAAVKIFAENLHHLLLSSPLGGKPVIGIDPGLRTGCKCAVVDATGKFLGDALFNITRGEEHIRQGKSVILALLEKHHPFAIAIGNGTASRETEAFVKDVIKGTKFSEVIVVQVSEAGASVYSASDVAGEEFPDLDLTVRGAISIARRLQDPLAELVKVDPKAIGVGQYQHDVHQPLLSQKLKDVVESCVNFVGVELNTASSQLLSYVSGIGPSMASKIVETREKLGSFTNRNQLLKVPGLGDKTFQQSAGFLRIRDGENPLDASAVHPESYDIVEQMVKATGLPLKEFMGNREAIERIVSKDYQTDAVGVFTLEDIIDELKKPGRDPRSCFKPPRFREDVQTINDLHVGMSLEGVVTNVTAFGAFVDIGVHQDGLVHVSQLSDQFITDPNQAVKAGDRIKVKVLEVDVPRKRISLTAKSGETVSKPKSSKKQQPQRKKTFDSSPFANL
ncbi:MAG: Tex family protein [Chlamydiota bacterium]